MGSLLVQRSWKSKSYMLACKLLTIIAWLTLITGSIAFFNLYTSLLIKAWSGVVLFVVILCVSLRISGKVQNHKSFNTNSVTGDHVAANKVFDIGLPLSKFPKKSQCARVCDYGGTEQLTKDSDDKGRIGSLEIISDDIKSVPSAITLKTAIANKKQYDFIIMSGVIEYLSGYDDLNHIDKILAPGGALCISDADHKYSGWILGIIASMCKGSRIRYRSENEVEEKLESLKYRVFNRKKFIPYRSCSSTYVLFAKKV